MKANNNPEMSMVNPSTDTLMKQVDSRYGLVVCASKRARQLLSGEELKELKSKSTKNVTNALEEIAEGKINYKISKADL
ncbi:DNA-directed RNA polymerase subunit omega [Selenomonas sp. GACV-9]|uniref:DNA-directed RNA polymerase subunit omega n=1 Tax=Selenomonas sp. GACV-9 TaxID=3158782 RepID=UPI0008DFE7A5|nr:DNA-directed RNA polymerase subunit omega [Selenomonas ruminantium]